MFATEIIGNFAYIDNQNLYMVRNVQMILGILICDVFEFI